MNIMMMQHDERIYIWLWSEMLCAKFNRAEKMCQVMQDRSLNIKYA